MKFIKLPIENCIINTFFTDANNPLKYRKEYCRKNCDFKCLREKKYKKK